MDFCPLYQDIRDTYFPQITHTQSEFENMTNDKKLPYLLGEIQVPPKSELGVWRECIKLLRIGKSGNLSWNCYPHDPIPDKWLKMDGFHNITLKVPPQNPPKNKSKIGMLHKKEKASENSAPLGYFPLGPPMPKDRLKIWSTMLVFGQTETH